jgi:prepilin-type N-terminal cleavage/methylation domain-containing protein
LNTQAAAKPSVRCCAFSIVEVLVVIAIIGILSAISIAYLGGYHRDVMLKVRDRRNAQEITALSMGATAAGAPVIAVGDMESTIQNLIEGREGTVGTFKGRLFRITALTDEEIAGALKHLEWQHGMPTYIPCGD